jgi:succinate dehydrogenase flavin-adding protein (antitoxin of CptAB toxin-antitoxin module)
MNKQSIWQIAFEFISIVFAVLLALGLNSYKQNKDLESESKLLTKKIIVECKRNFLELDTVITTNNDFLSYLDSLKEVEVVNSFNISIASELLTRSAWKFTQASNSYSYINEDFLNDATIMYEKQDYYMMISNQMFQNLGELLTTGPKPDKAINISRYYLSNLKATADDLMDTYKLFLEKHDE